MLRRIKGEGYDTTRELGGGSLAIVRVSLDVKHTPVAAGTCTQVFCVHAYAHVLTVLFF